MFGDPPLRMGSVMIISINLPAATECRLRALTNAAGKDLNTLVIEAVEWRLALADMSLRDILAPVHEDFRKSGMTTDELDAILRKAIAAGDDGAKEALWLLAQRRTAGGTHRRRVGAVHSTWHRAWMIQHASGADGGGLLASIASGSERKSC
jgi:hypothetical protein